jgi:hypothetical protein
MTDDLIHRTDALTKMGLARCRKDNKLFGLKTGACKICGITANGEAPAAKPKRIRKAKPAGGFSDTARA